MVLAHHLDDFQGCLAGTRGQVPYLIGHHGKTASVFTGTRRFNGGVQRQQVGLVGNSTNRLHNLSDQFRLFTHCVDTARGSIEVQGNFLDHLHRLLHHLRAFTCAGIILHRSGMSRLSGRLLSADLRGDVAGELDHLVQAPAGVEYWVVGRLEVNHLPQFVDPLEAMAMVLAAIERGPKRLVGR
ncbi:hypothetical protein D3C78_865150 [compost metagenome]